MTVTHIGEARRRREEHRATIATAADWIINHLPLAVPFRFNAKFHERWPGMSRAELDDVGAEVRRRLDGFVTNIGSGNFAAAAQGLSGRREIWMGAGRWLQQHSPDRGISDPDFVRQFGDITGAELVLAEVERCKGGFQQ